MNQPSENRAYFLVALIVKGIDSILEIVGGIAFLFAGTLMKTVTFLTDRELIEDPHDFIATHIRDYIPYLWHSPWFAAIYLLSHGIIKIVLVVALIYRKLWAYPVSLVVLGLFIIYQIYRYTHTHSIFLIALTFFDIILMVMIWREYKTLKHEQKP